ncbi:tripartite tricarboxylate transporter TctB family protein [Nitratireductor sp. ZSWI3]|uniref:tripartite tricarboxylate transporter TctB family protein n=1 Tax=Nitratireductor sp. ZSWI3 TaxID=2966359 RepID=UPI002150233F|nr:tripartite tricarboxylate transporter TctB family protein [Nitratireductor sp. ZSWI3]MCR4265370.1 tripartite tricarboxylate transporter TctB family protein [Nitratireductor sp. ZSWI3]
MSDRIFGVFGLLLAAFYLWQATQIELSFISDPFGPKAFPYMIGIVLAVASGVVVLSPDTEPEWPTFSRLFEIGVATAVMIAYALFLKEYGFIACTSVAAAYLCWRLGAHPLSAVIAGVAIAVGIYVIFHLVLGLSLARGPWGF